MKIILIIIAIIALFWGVLEFMEVKDDRKYCESLDMFSERLGVPNDYSECYKRMREI